MFKPQPPQIHIKVLVSDEGGELRFLSVVRSKPLGRFGRRAWVHTTSTLNGSTEREYTGHRARPQAVQAHNEFLAAQRGDSTAWNARPEAAALRALHNTK